MPSIEDYARPGLIPADPRETDPNRHQLLGIRELIAAGVEAKAFDYSKPFNTPVPPGEDQGSSSSCTAQAFAYYFWAWTGIQLSRQALYSEYYLPGGGGYLIDPFRMMMKNAKPGGKADGMGGYTRDQHQDPNPQTEQNMIIKVNLPNNKRRTFNIRYWYVNYNDIDAVAAAIKNWKGCVFGVYYNSKQWANGQHPDVVTPNMATTAHALYGMHVAIDRGQVSIVALSSWYNWFPNHYIVKDYFTKCGVFSPIVMEVTELVDDVLTQAIHVRFGLNTLGFAKLIDGRHIVGELASDATDLKQLEDNYGISFKDAHGNWYAPEMVIPEKPNPRYRLNFKGSLGFAVVGDGRQLVGELASNKEDLIGLEDNYNIKFVQPDGNYLPADIVVGA